MIEEKFIKSERLLFGHIRKLFQCQLIKSDEYEKAFTTTKIHLTPQLNIKCYNCGDLYTQCWGILSYKKK